MRFVSSRKWIIVSTSLWASLLCGCGSKADTSLLGTFRMGEKVQIGPLAYTVLESEWKNSLGENATSPAPRNRYLILRLSCENTGKASAVMPTMELESPAKQTYTEVTQGLQELPNWLGVLRTVQPGQ